MKGMRKKIVDVEFRGNDHFDEEELEDHVSVNKAGLLTKGSYDEKSTKDARSDIPRRGI